MANAKSWIESLNEGDAVGILTGGAIQKGTVRSRTAEGWLDVVGLIETGIPYDFTFDSEGIGIHSGGFNTTVARLVPWTSRDEALNFRVGVNDQLESIVDWRGERLDYSLDGLTPEEMTTLYKLLQKIVPG